MKNKPPKLSNTQNERMGGLIAVLCGREPYPWLLGKLQDRALVERSNSGYELTDTGINELERLMTLCGLAMFYRNGAPEIQATKAHRSPDDTGETL